MTRAKLRIVGFVSSPVALLWPKYTSAWESECVCWDWGEGRGSAQSSLAPPPPMQQWGLPLFFVGTPLSTLGPTPHFLIPQNKGFHGPLGDHLNWAIMHESVIHLVSYRSSVVLLWGTFLEVVTDGLDACEKTMCHIRLFTFSYARRTRLDFRLAK